MGNAHGTSRKNTVTLKGSNNCEWMRPLHGRKSYCDLVPVALPPAIKFIRCADGVTNEHPSRPGNAPHRLHWLNHFATWYYSHSPAMLLKTKETER